MDLNFLKSAWPKSKGDAFVKATLQLITTFEKQQKSFLKNTTKTK